MLKTFGDFLTLDDLEKKKLEYPCYLKIIASNVFHKQKANAVFYIKNNSSFTKLKSNIILRFKELKANSILYQPEVFGKEFIFGIRNDKKFGKIIVFGIGGSHTNEINDVSIRKYPLTKKDIISMFDDLKNSAYFYDIAKELLIDFIYTNQHIDKELEINPLIVNKESIYIIDLKIYGALNG